MGRWLSARLPGPLHWRLYDRDPALLRYAAAHLPKQSRDGSRSPWRPAKADIAHLTAADLADAGASGRAGGVRAADPAAAAPAFAGLSRGGSPAEVLVTASALLDLLTAEEVTALAGACVEARCPALFTLSVAGRVVVQPGRSARRADRRGVQRPPAPYRRRPTAPRPGRGRRDCRGICAVRAGNGGTPVAVATVPAGRLALIAAWLEGWVACGGRAGPVVAGRGLRESPARDRRSVGRRGAQRSVRRPLSEPFCPCRAYTVATAFTPSVSAGKITAGWAAVRGGLHGAGGLGLDAGAGWCRHPRVRAVAPGHRCVPRQPALAHRLDACRRARDRRT